MLTKTLLHSKESIEFAVGPIFFYTKHLNRNIRAIYVGFEALFLHQESNGHSL